MMTAYKNRRLLWLLVVLSTFMFFTIAAGDAQAGKIRDRKSKEHQDACNAWCEVHPDECSHCSTKSGCGQGYDAIQSWTGYGKNYYACKKRLTRREESTANMDSCNAWCRSTPDCIECVTAAGGCRSGLRKMNRWGGRGYNFIACGKRQYNNPASNWNRDECYKWCDENKPLCHKCDTNKGCANDYAVVKSWKGKGRNFHACAKRSSVKAKNKAECLAWCAEHPDLCVGCKVSKNCGAGLSHLKTFNYGKNDLLDYHACKKR